VLITAPSLGKVAQAAGSPGLRTAALRAGSLLAR
jgi:hypothetical protein